MKRRFILIALIFTLFSCTDKRDSYIGSWTNNPSGKNGGIGILLEITQDGDQILVRHKFLPDGKTFAQNNAKFETGHLILIMPSPSAFERLMYIGETDTISPVGPLSDVSFYRVK